MDLLVLGGSGFVGRALVDEGLASGWTVTTLNRGTARPVAGVTALTGDRTAPGGLAALGDRAGTSSQTPGRGLRRPCGTSAALLADRADRYVYISSRSVYAYPAPAGSGRDRARGRGVLLRHRFRRLRQGEGRRGAGVAEAFGDRGILAGPG